MNILEKLKKSNSLSCNEQLIAHFLVENTSLAVTLDHHQLAACCHVSVSCVYRLCRKMGHRGLQELKLHLSQEINESLSQYQDVDFSQPFQALDSPDQIVRNLTNLYKQTLDDTLRLLDIQILTQAVAMMSSSKRIFLIANGSSLLPSQSLLQKLQEIGACVLTPGEYADGRLFCSGADSFSCTLVLSYTGFSDYLLECVKELRLRQSKIILISSKFDNRLHHYADLRLYLCGKENPEAKIADYSSHCSAHFLCDLIFSLYYQKNYAENWKRRKLKTYL